MFISRTFSYSYLSIVLLSVFVLLYDLQKIIKLFTKKYNAAYCYYFRYQNPFTKKLKTRIDQYSFKLESKNW